MTDNNSTNKKGKEEKLLQENCYGGKRSKT